MQAFTVIFTVEAIIKITALSKEYFSVGWNIFDLVIVALSLPDLILLALNLDAANEYAEVASIIKVFRLVSASPFFHQMLLYIVTCFVLDLINKLKCDESNRVTS